jgi:alpha-methylacyl-CoA racemase
VVDAAMVDGSAVLTTMFHGMLAMGVWSDERGSNLLDTGAPFYDVYETADGEYISLGSLEPQFFAEMVDKTGLGGEDGVRQGDRSRWGDMRTDLADIIGTKTRAEWDGIMATSDVCYAPVLSLSEAPRHPHNVARGTFTEVAGVVQPAPAPRFSRTEAEISAPPAHAGQHTDDVLSEAGLSADRIAELKESGAVA